MPTKPYQVSEKKLTKEQVVKNLKRLEVPHLLKAFQRATDGSSKEGHGKWIDVKELKMLVRTVRRQGDLGVSKLELIGMFKIARYEKMGPKAIEYFEKLIQRARVPAPPKLPKTVANTFVVTFQHGGKIPRATKGKTATTQSVYESTVTVKGPQGGTFRGSIYPNNMGSYGRLKDGTYKLYIGFHQGGGETKQTQSALVVKTDNIRAALLVEARGTVDVISVSANKKTASGVNIHNGDSATNRGSKGCPTIAPTDWARFIQIFLDAFPKIDDWHKLYTNTGKRIGTLVVKK